MTTQETLTRINALMANPGIDALGKNELDKLAQELTAQLRREVAVSSHKVKPTEAITRMLKNVSGCNNPALKGAWMEDGRQCTCDGFRAFRLKDALPLPELSPEVRPLELNRLFDPAIHDYAVQLPLPSVKELKTFIALERAKADKKNAMAYDFGDGLPAVNACYLLDLLTVLPDATAFISSEPNGIISPIYAVGSAGDALLLPLCCQSKTAIVKARKERSAALRASGISPEADACQNTIDIDTFARCFAAA
jgi:hypothetical protein